MKYLNVLILLTGALVVSSSSAKQHPLSDEMQDMREKFTSSNPEYLAEVEEIATRELERLNGAAYLDYTGTGLYQHSQLVQIFRNLDTQLLGNAHSKNPSALSTNRQIQDTRLAILKYFDADPKEYVVIFTSGTTAALKLVAEGYPWSADSIFAYTRINHNSVLGMREYATENGGSFNALSHIEVSDIIQARMSEAPFASPTSRSPPKETHCLFAYPPKDNFAGMNFPLNWTEQIQTFGLSDECTWRVVLDAAAHVTLQPLSLKDTPADYVALSFYKMFGYPTGLGALIAKREAVGILKKVYFGGGSVVGVSCDTDWCALKSDPVPQLEDGTVNFIGIISLRYGLQKLQDIGIDRIHGHTAALTKFLISRAAALHHSNGAPLVRHYAFDDLPHYNGIFSFNILTPAGEIQHFSSVAQTAADSNVHIREGCFCNPGGCQDFLGFTSSEYIYTSTHMTHPLAPCSQENRDGMCLGAVRVSMGYMTTISDILRFEFYVLRPFLE